MCKHSIKQLVSFLLLNNVNKDLNEEVIPPHWQVVCLGGHGWGERLPARLFASVTGCASPASRATLMTQLHGCRTTGVKTE